MRRLARLSLYILVGNALCVAVGLWLFGSQFARLTDQALRNGLWSELGRDWERWESQAARPAGEWTLAEISDALRQHLPEGHFLVLDRAWTPVGRDPNVGVVRWSPAAAPDAADGPLMRGTIDLPDGPAVAVARALPEGYALLYRPLAPIQAGIALLKGDLGSLGLIALAWVCVLQAVVTCLVISRFRDTLKVQEAQSSHDALRQAQQLTRARDAIIFGLARLADSRDADTGDHLERMTRYVRMLTEAARRHPKFSAQITPGFVRLISLSAALHDVGKVGIEDRILQKRGSLVPNERERMQHHTLIAAECLRDIARRVGASPLLDMAYEIAIAHHERWDGAGYPLGLRGERIPLAARIVAVADVYDAMASRRVYKAALPHAECVTYIRESAGSHFDPDLVDVFLTVEADFAAVARQFGCKAEPSDSEGEARRLISGDERAVERIAAHAAR